MEHRYAEIVEESIRIFRRGENFIAHVFVSGEKIASFHDIDRPSVIARASEALEQHAVEVTR
jgi:hypothetical protein